MEWDGMRMGWGWYGMGWGWGWDGIDSPPLISPFWWPLFLFFAASCDSFINAFRRYRAFLLALLCFALVFVNFLLHILELRDFFSVSLQTLSVVICYQFTVYSFFLSFLSLSLSDFGSETEEFSYFVGSSLSLFVCFAVFLFFVCVALAGVVAALVKFFFLFFFLSARVCLCCILECHSKRKKKKKKDGGGLIR